MKKIDRLRKEARETATWRGHSMTRRWYLPCNEPARQVLRCTRCGQQAMIILNPAPNEIELSGEAIALNCDPSRKYQETIKDITQDINEIHEKTWIGPAIISHLRHFYTGMTEDEARAEVNLFFLRKTEEWDAKHKRP